VGKETPKGIVSLRRSGDRFIMMEEEEEEVMAKREFLILKQSNMFQYNSVNYRMSFNGM
jgi:hypothetical protein